MSDENPTATDEETDSMETNAAYALDERSLSDEEKDFARAMGFGESGNEPGPTAAVSQTDEAASQPADEDSPGAGTTEWEEIAPRSAAEGLQEPIEEYANNILATTGAGDTQPNASDEGERLRLTISGLETQLADRDLELDRLREAFERELSEQAMEHKNTQGLESEYEALSSEKDELIDQLAARSGELVRARDEIEQLSGSLRKARATLSPLPAGEKALRAEVLGLRARVSQLQQDGTQSTARAEGLQTELAIAEARLDERDHERDLIDGERQLLIARLSERDAELAKSSEREREILALNERLQSENQELRGTQIALEETLEARDIEISAREEHLSITREGLAQRDAQLLALSQERDQAQRRVEELESKQAQQAQLSRQLEDKVSRREARIAALTETLSQIEGVLGRTATPRPSPASES